MKTLFTLAVDIFHSAFRQIDKLYDARICVFKKLFRLLFLKFVCIDYKPHNSKIYISVSPEKISLPGLLVL